MSHACNVFEKAPDRLESVSVVVQFWRSFMQIFIGFFFFLITALQNSRLASCSCHILSNLSLHWACINYDCTLHSIPPHSCSHQGVGKEEMEPQVAGVTASQPGTSSHIKRSYSIHVTRQIWNVLRRESFFQLWVSTFLLSHTHKKKILREKEFSEKHLWVQSGNLWKFYFDPEGK